MSEVECTAVDHDGDESLNVLFVPPCNCPRCAAQPIMAGATPDNWLRVSGRRQRLRVEEMTLGATGRAMLG